MVSEDCLRKCLMGVTVFLLCVATSARAESGKSSTETLIGRWPEDMPIPSASPGGRAHSAASLAVPPILHGKESQNQFVVGIFFRDEHGTASICSGLNLSENFILTAKHCTCHSNPFLATISQDMLSKTPVPIWRNAKLYSQLGSQCRSLQSFNISEGNDLSLLKLEEPLASGTGGCADFGLVDRIHLEAFWAANSLPPIAVSGYGRDPAGAGSQEERLQANVSLNDWACSRQPGCVAFKEFVLGVTPIGGIRFDSCRGDSGGPAFVTENGGMTPLGTVSRALPNQPAGDCGSGGIYTHLGRTDVVNWLKLKTGQDMTGCGG